MMTHVLAHMTMSLDGFIADHDDGVGQLFDWYDAGSLEVPSANPDVAFRLDEVSAEMMRSLREEVGALVCGRRLFEMTDGWGDHHPMGVPVVVVTHAPPARVDRWPSTRFAPDVTSAIELARGVAGKRSVVVASADIAGQALELGLLDEVAVSIAPILTGSGKRYFGSLTHGPIVLEDPIVLAGTRATHLRYRVRRTGQPVDGG